jgi:4-hydroxybenzoate polyprenyltransferase
MLDWLRLVRLPNHATAAADVLAGFLVAAHWTGAAWPPAACWLAVLASLCFYAAGMVLNDVEDVEIDRRERPERPLPRGAIGVGSAARVGQGLLSGGTVAACAAAITSGHAGPAAVGAGLTLAVWLYDRHARRTPLGPAVMGACRGLNWLLGMTAAGGPTGRGEWLIPLGMAVYVAGITIYARDEAGRSRRSGLATGLMVMAAGLVIAAGHAWLGDRAAALPGGLRLQDWLLLWTLLCASIIGRGMGGVVAPVPRRVQAAVGNAIMSIITLDAAIVLAACGPRWALAVIALVPLFLAGRRIVPPT